MASSPEIMQALKAADAAGDTKAATRLAEMYKASVSQEAAATKPTFGQTAADMGMSAISGLGKGTAQLAGDLVGHMKGGLPFVQTPTQRVGSTMARALSNVTPSKTGIAKAAVRAALDPNAETFANMQDTFGSKFRPKTLPGKLTRTAAEFVPMGAVAGPGGIARRVAESAASGAASEAAGQLAKGSKYEDAARLAGAISTGAGTSAVKNMAAVAEAKALTPTIEGIKKARDALYEASDNAGLIINATKFKQNAVNLMDTLAKEGIDKTIHPEAFAAMKKIVSTPGNVTLKGVEILRKTASAASTSMNKSDRRMARIIVDHVDDFVQNLKAADTMGVDPKAATQMLSQARSLAAKAFKAEAIESLINKAKGADNFETAVRNNFRKLYDNPRGIGRFSAEEQEAIKKVARGEPIQNAQRAIGKLAPANVMTMAASLFQPAVLPVVAGSMAAKSASKATAAKNAQAVSQLVRGGKAAKTVPVLDRRALLAIQMANHQGQD
jgi:DNA-binding transcriptional regulator YdaS (Cro superfamily)